MIGTTHNAALTVALGTLMSALPLLTGCEMFTHTSPATADVPAFLPLIQSTYPDLASGRFLCLAHFEDPAQADFFRIVNADGSTADRAQPVADARHSRSETGTGGLYARLESSSDELRYDCERSPTIRMFRDWRDYALLLFSIHGPPGGTRMRLTIHNGADDKLAHERTINVAPGWNLCRVDLSQIADEVDLADVHRISWKAVADGPPLDVFLDDVILADNTRHILDEPGGTGTLFAFERGRGLHIGSRDRFELVFVDGLISAWYSETRAGTARAHSEPTSIELAQPPGAAAETARRTNLTVRTGLGPHPLPLSPEWHERGSAPVRFGDPELYAMWGQSVVANQWLREASPTRLVIQAQWSFVPVSADMPSRQTPTDSYPAHNWQYVIYPTGEIYVTVASVAGDVGWDTPYVGYAIALPGHRGFRRIDLTGDDGRHGVLMTRRGDHADLLWAPHWPPVATHVAELVSPRRRHVALVLGEVAARPAVEQAHLLRIHPRDINAAPEANAIANDYTTPATVTTTIGAVRRDIPGDLDQDGYNEAEGCHELALDAGVLRCTFDPGDYVRYAPRFRVHGITAEAPYWVYVNGQRLRVIGRDRDGAGLFTIPRALSQPVNIEVHAKSAATEAPDTP